ncbi:MAG: hypothetical protein WD875_08020 [Pirellulales bacterium]
MSEHLSASTNANAAGQRLVDSPWFWLCLFATAAVVALLAIGPKYRQREARLESTFRMREHLARSNAQRATTADNGIATESEGNGVNDDDQRLIRSTGPLIWILAAAVAAGWAALFWSRRHREVSPP